MTGGRVVVLGATGRNFAAGMSGGMAYVLDETGNFAALCNQGLVGLEALTDGEEGEQLKSLIFRHAELTRSPRATAILLDWDVYVLRFQRVMPHDYRRALAAQASVKGESVNRTPAEIELRAFEISLSSQ